MDGLALLCNLHADGPLTLRRLRDAGIRTLDQLVDAEPGSLTGLLRASPSHGRRFQREAVALRARIEESELEPELPRASSVPGELAPPLARVRRPQAFDLAPEPTARDVAPPARAVRESAPTVAADSPAPAPAAAGERPLATADQPLRAGEIVGLDARRCERLVREGVRTYRSLVDLAGLSLARRAEIPYTRLLDLRYHAQALLARRRAAAPPPAPEVAAPPAERVVTLRPTARRAPTGAIRGPRAVPTLRAEPGAAPVRETARAAVHEEPGVAGPFV